VTEEIRVGEVRLGYYVVDSDTPQETDSESNKTCNYIACAWNVHAYLSDSFGTFGSLIRGNVIIVICHKNSGRQCSFF